MCEKLLAYWRSLLHKYLSHGSSFDTNLTPTQAVLGDISRIYLPTPVIKMCAVAALCGYKRTITDSSGRICTAEVRGLNPLGSTLIFLQTTKKSGLPVIIPGAWCSNAAN
jgi:hypothetical protein